MRRIISMIVLWSIIISFIPVISFATNEYELNKIIEFEELELSQMIADEYTSNYDVKASKGKYIYYTGASRPAGTVNDNTVADMTVKVAVKEKKQCYVWFKYLSIDGASDSVYLSINGKLTDANNGISLEVHPQSKWYWKMIYTVDFIEGLNSISFIAREPNMKMDALYITDDSSFLPEDADVVNNNSSDTKDLYNASQPSEFKDKVYTAKDEVYLIEAEDSSVCGLFDLMTNSGASGGKAVKFFKSNEHNTEPLKFKNPSLSYTIKTDKTTVLYIYARSMTPTSAEGSVWTGIDNMPPTEYWTTGDTTKWVWHKIGSGLVTPGEHKINITHRSSEYMIDKFYITENPLYSPEGMGSTKIGEHDIMYDMPDFLPPKNVHPRIFFMEEDIEGIKTNLSHPENATSLAQHKANLTNTTNGTLPLNTLNNYQGGTSGIIYSRAFEYALYKDKKVGRLAIDSIINYLKSVTYRKAGYEQRGQIVFIAGIVYDWCYDLLREDEKKAIAEYAIEVARFMEVKYPPWMGGALDGHSVESQIQRDQMALAVATYDERPDIYQNVAGRLFKDFMGAREFLYPALTNFSGTCYFWRFPQDMLSTYMLDTLGMPKAYGNGDDQRWIMYKELYSRRPDGSLLREGDNDMNNEAIYKYNTRHYTSLFLAGNYWKDPYLKRQAFVRNVGWENTSWNNMVSCVDMLIFNKPGMETRSVNELPLSRYFPSPKGMMIARTGWKEGLDAPDTVVSMNVGEYWASGHQHFDAGNFQIYYKGPLAIDSGYYQSKRSGNPEKNEGNSVWGTEHFHNYYRRSIAHNTMLVYDPNEDPKYYTIMDTNMIHEYEKVNDGGQRIITGGIVAWTIDEYMEKEDEYRTGYVLGHEIGLDPVEPNYTYLKGDIAKAYSDKVKEYERSFMFLNLKNGDHPAALLVFDRVVSADKNFKKTWLLHGLKEPDVNGNQTVFKDIREGYNGKLTVDTLMPAPENTQITKVGGPGAEFMSGGTNWWTTPAEGSMAEGGEWRIEISPKQANEEDYFLNVLQVGDAKPDMPPLEVKKLETEKLAGAVIADRAVLFGKAKERISENIEFSLEGDKEYEITVASVKEGTWEVKKDGEFLTKAVVTKDGGVAVFSGKKGNYEMTLVSSDSKRDDIEVNIEEKEGIRVLYQGLPVYFDVEPTIVDGRTLVPLYAIYNKFGATVEWDDKTKTATANRNGRIIKITADSSVAYVDGEECILDVPAKIINCRMMVPLRFIAESLMAEVKWDDFSKTITLGGAFDVYRSDNPAHVPVVNVKWSSESSSERTGKEAVDGKTATRWAADGKGEWLLMELEEKAVISSFKTVFADQNSRTYNFELYASSDGVEFTKIFDGVSTTKDTYDIFTVKTPVEAKFIKLVGQGGSNTDWLLLHEIELYK